jgi:hypothetical protein
MTKKGEVAKKFAMLLPKLLGKSNSKTSDEVIWLLDAQYSHKTSDCYIRKLAKDFLRKDGIPVCSCPDGFFVATKKQEILDYRDNLTKRKLTLEKNIRALDGLLQEQVSARLALRKIKKATGNGSSKATTKA